MQEMLAALWQQHQSTIMERVEVLEHAHRSLIGGSLTREQWDAAAGAAHKLAGVLGTFGRAEATDLARKVENWPTDANGIPLQAEQLAADIALLRTSIS